jgi:hypothetical protein
VTVRISFPKTKLAKILRSPGGLPVVEALANADAKLAELKPDCLKELQELNERIRAAFQRVESDAEGGRCSEELYGLAAEGVGLGRVAGLPAVDQTLVSLCRLMDYFETHGQWDLEALRVHVQTLLVLLSGTTFSAAGVEAVLGGLEKVNARYKAPGQSD